LTCEQNRVLRRESEDVECIDREYIEATSKPCPSCGYPTSKFHGHGCHHVSPGTTRGGCARCGTHWCYACGATGEENERERHRRSRCRCPSGTWSTFCSSTDLAAHLAIAPYPHDTRCGCLICPTCDPIRGPCPQCDGTCVVCLGIVPPIEHHVLGHGPYHRFLRWFHQCACALGTETNDPLANYR